MLITYDIRTPFIGDARTSAIRRAKAEGWRNIVVVSVYPTVPGEFSVTLTVAR